MSFKDILSVLQINSLPKDIFFTFLQRLTKIIAQFGRNEVLRFQEFGKIITVQTGRKSKEQKSLIRTIFANKCHRGLPNIHLLVDQVCGNRIFCGIVPGGKDFFPEEKPPGGVALLSPLLFGVLLALGYSIHHVVSSTAQ